MLPVQHDDAMARALLADPLEARSRRRTRTRSVAGVLAAGALAAAALTGLLLGWRYLPSGFPSSERVEWSHQLVRAHRVALAIAVPAVGVWGVLTIRESHVGIQRGRGVVEIGAAVAAFVLAVVAWFSWSLVRYEQVALWTVTVDHDVDGLVWAAFHDEVRFVIVDGVEVSQGTLAWWVVIHLVAPVLALASIGIAGVGAREI